MVEVAVVVYFKICVLIVVVVVVVVVVVAGVEVVVAGVEVGVGGVVLVVVVVSIPKSFPSEDTEMDAGGAPRKPGK